MVGRGGQRMRMRASASVVVRAYRTAASCIAGKLSLLVKGEYMRGERTTGIGTALGSRELGR